MDPIEAVTAQSDWEQNDDTKIDYIKNKPFGEETVEDQVVIEYDGDYENHEFIDVTVQQQGQTIAAGYYVKVSENTPDVSVLEGARAKALTPNNTATEATLDAESIEDFRNEGKNYLVITVGSENTGKMFAAFVVAYGETDFNYSVNIGNSSITNSCHIPSAGIWAVDSGLGVGKGGYPTYLSYSGIATIIKKIDDKFIPDTIARVSDLQVLQDALGAYITDINALIGGDE